jgi:hypothetical protein
MATDGRSEKIAPSSGRLAGPGPVDPSTGAWSSHRGPSIIVLLPGRKRIPPRRSSEPVSMPTTQINQYVNTASGENEIPVPGRNDT